MLAPIVVDGGVVDETDQGDIQELPFSVSKDVLTKISSQTYICECDKCVVRSEPFANANAGIKPDTDGKSR
jgi:hypothetical protein